jgi:hypothetical protein
MDRSIDEPGTPARWASHAAALARAGALVEELCDKEDIRNRVDFLDLLTSVVVSNYLASVQSDARYPDIVPMANCSLPLGVPCPDFNYFFVGIEEDGLYRLSGRRGTNLFVNIQAGARFWGFHGAEGGSAMIDGFWLDDFVIGDDGRFEIWLGSKKPERHAGNWWTLPVGTTYLCIRSGSYDWETEIDASFAIERLDTPAARPRLSAEDLDRRIARVFEPIAKAAQDWPHRARLIAEKGGVNQSVPGPASQTGSGIAEQLYYSGLFDLEQDECLIFEMKIPERVFYWGMHLTSLAFTPIDAMHRQSSINGHQAWIDTDGWFRAVLSARDPGIANWLDASGYPMGLWAGRWFKASEAPAPKVTKVAFDQVLRHLPRDTPLVSPEERETHLRRRREALQLRRRW